MALYDIEDDDYFEFEPKELDADITFNFSCKFKIVDMSGYRLHIHKIYKRSLSKKNLEVLETLMDEKFPILINDVSGLEIESLSVNKLYDGEFELNYYTDGSIDLYLGAVIDNKKK
jgi:hypothetical protein